MNEVDECNNLNGYATLLVCQIRQAMMQSLFILQTKDPLMPCDTKRISAGKIIAYDVILEESRHLWLTIWQTFQFCFIHFKLTLICCLELLCHVFQWWLPSECPEEVLELGWVEKQQSLLKSHENYSLWHDHIELTNRCRVSQCDKPFSGGCFLSTRRSFWNLAGSTAIWSLIALSSLVFLRRPDSPAMPTSSMTVSDTALLEYSSHVSSSGSCIPLMRSAEHFRKASDSALRGVVSLFSNLRLVSLDECRAEGGQNKYVNQEGGNHQLWLQWITEQLLLWGFVLKRGT